MVWTRRGARKSWERSSARYRAVTAARRAQKRREESSHIFSYDPEKAKELYALAADDDRQAQAEVLVWVRREFGFDPQYGLTH